MAQQNLSAPSRASSAVPGRTARSGASGVVHDNVRHTSRYTVVGNHLAQHRELSLLAIGLAVHIQSLPAGARIGIKFLAARFPESEYRIAAALRELEAHGYLRRTRERLPSGKVVTRTVSRNQPSEVTPGPASAATPVRPAPAPAPPPPAEPTPTPVPRTQPPPLPEPATPTPDRLRAATELLADLGYRRDTGQTGNEMILMP